MSDIRNAKQMDPDNSTQSQKAAATDLKTKRGHFDSDQPISIPDHELLRVIGKGSYGTVWMARNIMGIYRAVKIVYRNSFADDRPFKRELSGIKKFEPISRSHEGFVDVLHVGIKEDQGCFYYVMELGDDQAAGQNFDPASYSSKMLNKEISLRGRLSFQECLHLGIALSDALGELHKHGLVHRDVKPSNIIFVNGVPKLADIGLVAEMDETNTFVGTQGYIPPEGPGSFQADIYGLGKVLYEASTGKDRQDFPELPTELEGLADQEKFLELNEVLLQACKNDISRRYQFAWDMHTDLLVVAKGKSVKRLRVLEERMARAKRLTGIAILTLLLLTAIGYPLYRERKANAATRQRQIGEAVAYGNRAVEMGDPTGALPFFATALRLEQGNTSAAAAHRLRFSSALSQCPKLIQVWSVGSSARDGEFSPDGKFVLISREQDGALIYNIQTGERYAPAFGQKHLLDSGSFSPDGLHIVTASETGTACVWDTATLKLNSRLPHPDRVFSAKFSPNSKLIVTACLDTFARVWQAQPQLDKPKLVLIGHTNGLRFAIFSHDGTRILTASQDHTARLWNADTGNPIGKPFKHKEWVNYAAFSPDDSKIVTACGDHKARVWAVAAGDRILIDMDHKDAVQSAEFSPDGRLILTASLDGTARIWRADNGEPLYSNLVLRHSSGVMHASFSPDGSRILTVCSDGTVSIWDLGGSLVPPIPLQRTFSDDGSRFLVLTNELMAVFDAKSGTELSHLTISTSRIKNAELNRNGQFILSISDNTTNQQLQVWSTATGKADGSGLATTGGLTNFSLSDDGKNLAIRYKNSVEAWDMPTGKALFPPLLHLDRVESTLFSPNGKLLTAGCGTNLFVWNVATGEPAFDALGHPRSVSYVTFNSTSAYLVTCYRDDQLTKCCAQIWDTTTGKPVGPQLWHGDGVLFAAFSPDSKHIVTAGEDHNAFVWDVPTGRRRYDALQHKDQVLSAAFSPDGKWIVTVCSDKTARVWSTESGDPITPPLRHLRDLKSAVFLPDGRRIAVTDKQGNSWIWELPMDNRPVEDQRKLASLLAGDASSSSSDGNVPQSESTQSLWQRLRGPYPDTFATSSHENEAWHEFEVEENESEQQWFAAAFHLKRLLSIHPEDQQILKRLANANSHLQETAH